MAELSKARVCGRSLAGVACSNPAGGMDVCVLCDVQKGQKAKAEESRQRSTDKVRSERERETENSRWGRGFPHPSSRPWGPSSLLYNGCRVPLPGVKRSVCGVNDEPSDSADAKEREELYPYNSSGSSWPVLV